MGKLSNLFDKAVAFNKKVVKSIVTNGLVLASDKVTGTIMPDDKDFILSSGSLVLNISNVTSPFFAVTKPVSDIGTEFYVSIGKPCAITFTATSLFNPKNAIKEFRVFDITSAQNTLTAVNGSATFIFSSSVVGDYTMTVIAVDVENNKSVPLVLSVHVRKPFIVQPCITVPVTSVVNKSTATPFAIDAFTTSPANISTLKQVSWMLRGGDGRAVWSANSAETYINGPRGADILDMTASAYYEITKQTNYSLILKSNVLITESGVFTPAKSLNYTVTCIGAGGNGGTGGKGNGSLSGSTHTAVGGGGGGGGGAGEVITKAMTLRSDTVYPVTIGVSGGSTAFGSDMLSRGGISGTNGTNATTTVPGSGGSGGSSQGNKGLSGSAGSTVTGAVNTITSSGGAGGNGGLTTDENGYGSGGKGGDGGAGSPININNGTAGAIGTQGCIRVISTSETNFSIFGKCICFSPAMSLFYSYNGTTGIVLSSSDGSIWSQMPAFTVSGGLDKFGFGNESYVIFASDTNVVISPNGSQWTQLLVVTGDEKITGIYDGTVANSFIIATNSRLFFYTNATNYSVTANTAISVAASNDKVVGITAISQIMVISNPTTTLQWEPARTPVLSSKSGVLKGIVFFKNKFVMIDDRYIHYSSDLVTWTSVDSALSNLKKIQCTESELIIISDSAIIAMTDLVNIICSSPVDSDTKFIAIKNKDTILAVTSSTISKYKMTQLSESFDITATVSAVDSAIDTVSTQKKTYRYRLD